jgi:flagellar motor protein MotB
MVPSGAVAEPVSASVALAPAAPSSLAVSVAGPTSAVITWSQTGAAKLFEISVTAPDGKVTTFTTGDRNFKISTIPGKEYKISVVAIGQGDVRSQAALFTYSPVAPIFSVLEQPFENRNATLVSWQPSVLDPAQRFTLSVNGKVICKNIRETQCVVGRVLTAKDVVVVTVNGISTQGSVDDSKLKYAGTVEFVPNTATLAPGAKTALLATAKKLKAAGFKKIVVTGHANTVANVPLYISSKIAAQRALLVASALRK